MFEDDKTSWEDADQVRTETSGGTFIRLKDRDKVLVVFPVGPFAYRQVWCGDHSEIYDEDKHDGQRPQGRFAFPVFCPVPGKKEYEAKIFDASGETFDAIKKVRSKYGARHLYEIERKGTGTDTKYSILPERELADAEVEYLKTQTPLDAEKITLGVDSIDDPATSTPAPKGSDPWS